MDTLANLAEKSHGAEAAQRLRDFVPDSQHVQQLASIGREILFHIKPASGACALMSALWAAIWQVRSKLPAYVVAGDLWIKEKRIFGDDRYKDWSESLSQSNLSWDGHCWLAFGTHIADISIFRTAYAPGSPAILSQPVVDTFGSGRGLLICPNSFLLSKHFRYEPRYVLTQEQHTGLVAGASAVFCPSLKL